MANSVKSRDHLSNHPNLSVHSGSGTGAVNARVTSRTSVGMGALGVTTLLLTVIAAISGVGWLGFDAIRSLPRDEQGRVTILGIPVPVPFAPPPAAGDDAARDEPEDSRESPGSAELLAAAAMPSEPAAAPPRPKVAPVEPTPAPATPKTAPVTPKAAPAPRDTPPPDLPPATPAPTAAELNAIATRFEGLWNCAVGGWWVKIAFTETRKVTLFDERDADGTTYKGTPFAPWRTATNTYEVVSKKTLEVADQEVAFELRNGDIRLRLIGGMLIFECQRT